MTSRRFWVWLVATLSVAIGLGCVAMIGLRGSEAARALRKTPSAAARTTGASRSIAPEPNPGMPAASPGQSQVTIRGSVVGPEREAVTDGVVCLVSRPANDPSTCVKVTEGGRFDLKIDTLLSDAAALSASAWGFLDKVTSLSSEQRTGTDSLVVTLQRAPPNLRGRVLDAMGGTITGATVTAQTGGIDETGQNVAEVPTNPLLAATVTDELGRFQLSLPGGLVLLTARADGYSRISAHVRIVAQSERLIDLALTPGSAIVGRLLDNEFSAPVRGISVHAQRVGTVVSSQGMATTDSEGRFRIQDLTAGSYRLTLQSTAWTVPPTTVPVDASSEASAELVAQRAGSIVIRAQTRNGEKCASGFAALEGSSFMRVSINEDGEAVFGGVVPGNYRASISCDNVEPMTQEVSVKAGDQSKETTEAPALVVVRGRVRHKNQPLSGSVDVTLASATGTSVSCSSDEDGKFSCSVNVGTYSCFATANGTPITDVVQVNAGADGIVDVELSLLEARGNVELSMHQGTGDSNLVSLFLRSTAGTFTHGMNLRNGIYRFTAVELGRHDVVLGSPNGISVGSVYLKRANETVKETITIKAHHAVYGSVVDSEGEPVPDAWVTVSPLNAPLSRTTSLLTDASGRFKFAELVAGTYRVLVESTGGSPMAVVTETNQAIRVTIASPEADQQ